MKYKVVDDPDVELDVESILDATDDLIDCIQINDANLQDPFLMQKVAKLRSLHKSALQMWTDQYIHDYSSEEYQNIQHYSHYSQNQQHHAKESPSYSERRMSQHSRHDVQIWTKKKHHKNAVRAHVSKERDIGDSWYPGITVPQPFAMTIRDEIAPIKADYSARFHEEMMGRKAKEIESDELSTSRSFRAQSVPAETRLPLFAEIQRQTVSRRTFIRNHRSELLQSMQQPFNVTAARLRHNCTPPPKEHKMFRANPLPEKVAIQSNSNKERERKDANKQRAMDLLQSSALPGNMKFAILNTDKIQRFQQRNDALRPCSAHSTCAASLPQRVHSKPIPDFQRLHNEFDAKLSVAKISRQRVTVVEAFDLTQKSKKNRYQQEYGRPIQPMKRAQSLSFLSRMPEVPVKNNTTSVLRRQLAKQRLSKLSNDTKELREYYRRREAIRQGTKETMLKDARLRVQNDQLENDNERRVQYLRKQDSNRVSDYQEELIEIERRAAQKPSLVDRQQTLVYRQMVSNKFAEIESKLSRGKGHTTRGRHSSERTNKSYEIEDQNVEINNKYDDDEQAYDTHDSGIVAQDYVSQVIRVASSDPTVNPTVAGYASTHHDYDDDFEAEPFDLNSSTSSSHKSGSVVSSGVPKTNNPLRKASIDSKTITISEKSGSIKSSSSNSNLSSASSSTASR